MTNRDLVEHIRNSLPETLRWTEVDETVLALADAQARDLDELEGRDDLAGVRERRFQRAALCRIIGQLDLPENARSTVLKAQRAARTRWGSAAS